MPGSQPARTAARPSPQRARSSRGVLLSGSDSPPPSQRGADILSVGLAGILPAFHSGALFWWDRKHAGWKPIPRFSARNLHPSGLRRSRSGRLPLSAWKIIGLSQDPRAGAFHEVPLFDSSTPGCRQMRSPAPFTTSAAAPTFHFPPENQTAAGEPTRRKNKTMGDKSPKSNQKKSSQKQAKESSADQQRKKALADKAAAAKKKN